MSLKVINFDLNFIPTGVPPIVHIHQYDLGEIVTLRPTLYYRDELYNGMNLEECDFIVAYQRPDGSQQSYTIENHVFYDEYVFEFPLDANMTAMHGPNVMSLGFVDRTTNNILWTQNFILFVERHPIQSEDYMGSSVYDGMLRLLQRYVDEAYAATPPGYEEHIAKIREVENTIDDLREEIQENLEEANAYTDQQMGGLDSIYATLQDIVDAQNEGRAYAGQLVGDTETRINSDMALMYQLKSDAETDKTDLQIYAEQVSTASATEIKDYLGLDYTSAEPGLTETGLLNTVITQTAESIVQEATAEFMTESEADGIITTKVNSKVEQKANDITTTVAELYETKEDASQKLSDAQSYTNSQISQKASEITSTVKAYTDDSISNLNIGAQNLLRGTNEYKTTDTEAGWIPSYNNGGWQATGTVTAYSLEDNPGNGFTIGAKIQNGSLSQNSIDFLVNKKAYVLRMYLKGSGLPDPHGEKSAIDSALKNIVYFRNTATGNKLVLDYATETDQETGEETVIRNQSFNYHYPYKEVVTYPTYIEEDEQGNQVTKVRKQVDYVEITDSPWIELEWYILCDEWPENVDIVVDSPNGTLDVCGIKMEEGSKATAWQPNEFDIKRYTNTQIQQTNERIRLIAEAQDTTDGDLSTLRSEFDIEAGKIAAMVAAGYIEPDGNQGWTSSYSTQQEKKILNQVSSAYATKERVNEVESKIVTTDTYTRIVSKAISEIKIGGENLIRSTELVSETVPSASATWALADAENGWYKQGNSNITLERTNVSNAPSNGIRKGWRFTHSGNITSANHATVAQYSVPVTYQQEYTISFYARLVSGAARAFCQTYISASGTHTHTQSFDELTSDWKRCVFTFTHDFENSRNQTGIYFGIEWDASVAGVIEICGLKLELGNVATDWCPSVYDMEAYTQASITVSTNSIIEDVSTIDGRVSTVEQTAEGFKQVVTWKDNFELGGENLLRGTDVFNFISDEDWANAGNDTWKTSEWKKNTNAAASGAVTVSAITDPPCGGVSKVLTITGQGASASTIVGQYINPGSQIFATGKKYVLTIYARVNPNSSADSVTTYNQSNGYVGSNTSISNLAANNKVIARTDGWTKITTPLSPTIAELNMANAVFNLDKRFIFWFGIYGAGTIDICGIKLEEGTVATGWSPSRYDIDDGFRSLSTQITQTQDAIDLCVKDADLTGDNVISRINLSGTTATIAGERVHIEGNTTFTNMQSAVQNAVSGSVKRIYYRTTTDSQPSAPSSGVTTGVTSTATTAGGWRTVIPTFSPGDTFYWTCEEYKKNDNKFYYTNVSPFHATTIDGANIYAGSITLTSFDSTTQNTINTASADASTAKSDASTAKTTAENAVTRYGQCTTGAGTAAKAVTLTTGKLGTLAAGAVVAVYFTNANTAATPTLNVNNTGAKQIRMVHGTAWETGSNWKAGAVLTFTYDGTYWIVTNGSQTKDAYDKANSASTTAGNALTAANKAVVESVTVYYCYDSQAPTQPTNTEITETSSAVDQWTLRMPNPVYNGYYYECTQQKLNDGTFTFTPMRRMSFTEGIAKWISSTDATKIDGGHIYSKSVDTGALNLYGELEILQSATGNVGGYMGYETGNNGVDDTNGMLIRAGDDDDTTYDYYASKYTYKSYIHLSDSGAIIRSPYIQLRQSGTQAVKIINTYGLNLKEYRSGSSNLGKMAITAQSYADDSVRADLTINAKTLKFNASDNNFYYMPYSTGDAFYLQPGGDYGRVGSYGAWWEQAYIKTIGYDTLAPRSDRRVKKDIVYSVPDIIDRLKPVTYRYDFEDESDQLRYGLIAQDVLEVDDNLPVIFDDCGTGEFPRLGVKYVEIVPLLIDKCQKLQKQIDELKGESS